MVREVNWDVIDANWLVYTVRITSTNYSLEWY
jgi:hypothetical protein